MNNLMNKNFFPNNIQEEKLYKEIQEIKNSAEIQKFINKISEAVNNNVEIFSYRIKEPFSAIRTYRLTGYKDAEQLHDLLGFLFVVDNVQEIPLLEKKLKDNININNIKIYNLLEEKKFNFIKYNKKQNIVRENQYNKEIIKDINKWLELPNSLDILLPPFSYNLIFKKKFSDITNEIPIEFRIQTKEDFITTESYYYTIHKNDTIPLNIKIPLLCMFFRILRRKSNIAFENKENDKLELKQILNLNKEFIEENKKIVEYVFSEHERILNCWKNKLPIYEFHWNNISKRK